jgi:hypothetical protein
MRIANFPRNLAPEMTRKLKKAKKEKEIML